MNALLPRIHPVTTRRAPVSAESLARLESACGRLPSGYRDFMAELGVGTLTTWVRVHSPGRIAAEQDEWRARIGADWFWSDDGGTGLDQRRALECVRFADTLGGDELIAHPDDPDSMFVLPRNDERVWRAGTGLAEALTWLHESGRLTAPLALWYFEPWVSWARLDAAGTGAEHDAIVAAVEGLGLVERRADAGEEEDGPFTTLLLPAIGGLLTVHDASSVALFCDPSAEPRLLAKLEKALVGVGCAVGPLREEPAPSSAWLDPGGRSGGGDG